MADSARAVPWRLVPMNAVERAVLSLWLLCAALVIASRWIPGLWACDLHCAGAQAWSAPLGIDSTVLAAVLVLVTALAVWLRSALAVFCAAGAVAGSLGYALWAWRIGLPCDHCVVSHCVTIPPCAWIVWRAHGWLRIAACAVAVGVGVGLWLRLSMLSPLSPSLPSPPDSGQHVQASALEAQLMQRIEAGRLWPSRSASSPIVIDVGLDLRCSRCAELAAELPDFQQRHPQVALRIRVLAADALSATIARHIAAAAADGPAALRRVLSVALGQDRRVTWNDLRPRMAEFADVAAIDERALRFATVLDAWRQADEQWLRHAAAVPAPRVLRAPLAIMVLPDGSVRRAFAVDVPQLEAMVR